MNRFGFVLLTFGATLAFLGWHYGEDFFAAEGFFLLIFLSILASIWPTSISYKPEVERLPMGTAAQRAWGAYYVVAGFMAFGGLAHTQAGGNGQWVCLSGFALLASLAVYDAFHVERFRAWRLERLRAARVALGR